MLKGIKVKPLRRFADERGFFTELMRKDWQLLDDELVQANGNRNRIFLYIT